MNIHFKITGSLLEKIRENLSQPHPFAFERVGFLFIRQGTAAFQCDMRQSVSYSPWVETVPKWYTKLFRSLMMTSQERVEITGASDSIAESRTQTKDTLMILVSTYAPVRDEDYINDPTVGAKIDSSAIRRAMQQSLDTGMGVIHVHMHVGTGRPSFSPTDRKSMNTLMPSFFNVSPNVPHGALVFNRDRMTGIIWSNKKTSHEFTRVSVVSYPCQFSGGIKHV